LLLNRGRHPVADLERFLPPPDCAHVLINGHIVLLNRRTNVVVDFVHLELF